MSTATTANDNADLRKVLQVAPPSEIVRWMNILPYGDVGAGKTHFMGTADDDERTRPLLVLDIEGGLATIANRSGVDVISIRTLAQLEETYDKIYKSIDLTTNTLYWKTIGIDSLPELADLDMRTIMKEAYQRSPDKVDPDVPSQREWGKSRAHMRSIVRGFRDLPCNVIMTAQVGTLQEEGQPTKHFPGFAGKLRTEIPGFMDIVGYLQTEVEGEAIIRKMQVQGTRRVVAKDRTSALGSIVESPTIPLLLDLIQTHQSSVNGKTAASK